jgi:hypothetical protein
MKNFVPLLIALAAFSVARADNPPARAAGATAPAATAATAATAAPASAAAPATAAAHEPPKAIPPWKMYTRKGKPVYCIEVARQNSRISETRCVDEQEYAREMSDSEQVRQRMMQGANGCQPTCGK